MRFVKEILRQDSEGVSLWAKTPTGPQRINKTWEPKDLDELAEIGTAQLQAGHRIAAPLYDHHDQASPTVFMGNVDPKDLSFQNGGFWEQFYVSDNEEGTKSLYGVIEAPGTAEDKESPAYAVSRRVKDTSIAVASNFEDGKGKKWAKAFMHIALPLQPVQPGQTNFIPLPENVEGELIAMSLGEPASADIPSTVALLRKVGIVLPEGTNELNFLDRLNTALGQKASTQSSDDVTTPPHDSRIEDHAIMMSLTKPQTDAIVKAGVQNPVTGKPFAPSDFQDDGRDPDSLEKQVEQLKMSLSEIKKDAYKSRIQNLVGKTITSEYAEKTLGPQIESLQMSLNAEGKIEATPLDTVLDTLEAFQAQQSDSTKTKGDGGNQLLMSVTPPGTETHISPSEEDVVDDDEAAEAADWFLKETDAPAFG